MSLSFIHTADWHLGHTYWKIGARATESKGWRFDAVRRIWELAQAENSAFILVAGDVFDTETPSPAVKAAAIELLADAPAPVYLISGNHDPNAEGSIWRHADFLGAVRALPHVQLALENQPVEAENGALIFPCAVTRKHSRADATSWIPAGSRGESYRIGLAHGAWRGYFGREEGVLNCISSDCAQRAGLDYLALGDYHSFTPADHQAARARSFYAGTPEIGARDNVRGGHALSVKFDGVGADPRVTPHKVGKIELVDLGRIEIFNSESFEAFQKRTQGIPNPENTILRARLHGQIAPSLLQSLGEWLGDIREELLGLDCGLEELMPQPTRADFEDLKLEGAERDLLNALESEFALDDLEGIRNMERLQGWSGDEKARREALALAYRWMKTA